MKIILAVAVVLVIAVASSDAFRRKKAVETPSSLFLGFLKRQNKDLTKTIDDLEELQYREKFVSAAREKFWEFKKGEVNTRCCGCPVGSCECCSRTGIGFCCDFLDKKNTEDADDEA